MPIAAEEDIVRAIFTDKWDGTRMAPSLFTGENISVNRLAVISLAEHWDMFRKHLEKPPERRLALIGEINVGHLQTIGRSHSTPIELTVEPRAEDWNPAHAEIPQRITRGLATKIVNTLTRHSPPRRNQASS
jgi:hypothetical protein